MTDEKKRAIWVGCLGCYNDGRLVGEWMNPADYDPEDPKASIPRLTTRPDSYRPDVQVIICGRCGSDDCNRWVMDHENFGGALSGECTADEAHRVDALLTEIEDDTNGVPAAVVIEFIKDYTGETPTEWDAPTKSLFEDRYAGTFDSDRDLAYDAVENQGWAGMHPVPEEVSRYFDWDLIARELRMEHSIIEHDNTRYYFRSQ